MGLPRWKINDCLWSRGGRYDQASGVRADVAVGAAGGASVSSWAILGRGYGRGHGRGCDRGCVHVATGRFAGARRLMENDSPDEAACGRCSGLASSQHNWGGLHIRCRRQYRGRLR